MAHAAAQFPQLCEAETEVFARLLGKHVQRLATIAHGDGVCTTHIPSTSPAAIEGYGVAGRLPLIRSISGLIVGATFRPSSS